MAFRDEPARLEGQLLGNQDLLLAYLQGQAVEGAFPDGTKCLCLLYTSPSPRD